MLGLFEQIFVWKDQLMQLEWTTRVGLCGLTSLLTVFLIFKPFHKIMTRISFSEVIRNDPNLGKLNELHAKKKNTITMGGILLLAAVIPSVLVWAEWSVYVLVGLFVYASFASIGFADDYLKISKKNKKGLDGKYKLLFQTLITAVALGLLLKDPLSGGQIRELWLPLMDEAFIPNMPIWMTFGLLFFVLLGTSNTVNLTDGADGLAIGCSISTLIAFAIVAYIAGLSQLPSELNLNLISGSGEIAMLCIAMVGAGFGFLWFNGHPAKVFMGDTGSLGLGGLIGIVAFMLNQPLTLVLIGGIFVVEGLSVILQVVSFQIFGKRLFKISPIHHHFEVVGWAETQVVTRFWILSGVFALVGMWTFTI